MNDSRERLSDLPIRIPDPADAPLPGCTFTQAVRRYFAGYVKFSGRASRSELWKVNPLVGLIFLFGQLAGSGGFENAPPATKAIVVASWVIYVICFLPSLSVGVRRLHDANFSGGLILLTFIPFVGGLILFVLYLMDSNPEGSRFDRTILRYDLAG
ncbi:DUF805 domain-containing protein [Microlunatus parietis]|uniref:Uncharacterized membrane protein YhaH (DUF805 family) n=1 Tax=Microlunatus parietis TaxID=682979 RepID=A0A7Y9IBB6_9ACTN|nr:DUF805 domain-containing protein [Microlunatus parietis]NYE73781.1 uncharacterized membrane protein YhaH (DUF805 family) [Microlunatus parietis]